jgi:hypothetical protein
MKLYLCARYGRREELLEVAERAKKLGYTITSRWLTHPADVDDGGPMSTTENWKEAYCRDITDIEICDMLVAFTEDPAAVVPGAQRGGRHVEFGYAMKANKVLAVVGPRENLFMMPKEVMQFSTVTAFITWLERTA